MGHLLYLDNLKKKEMVLNKQTKQKNNSHATEMFVFKELASLPSFPHEKYGNALFFVSFRVEIISGC